MSTAPRPSMVAREGTRGAPWSVLHRMGAAILVMADQVGGITVLAGRILRRLVPPRLDRVELTRNLYKMGVESTSIVVATAAFTGAIMVIQSAPIVTQFDAKGLLGWGAGFAILREVAPLLIALMFNGRVGANNTAELGTMVVTEQVDALRALAIDPIAYLVLPRVIAMVTMMVVLTIIGDGVAVGGAIVAGKILLEVEPALFMSSFAELLGAWDFFSGIIKSLCFGVMIALGSCYFGLNVKGGAPGVGRAVNAAVVAAASGIFILDFFSTFVIG